MNTLQDKLALVTGASAGIGAAIARSLAGAGAQVLLAARRRDRLEALASEIGAAEVLELDVRDAAAVEAALDGRPIEVLVNNAGMAIGLGRMHEGSAEGDDRVIDTNVKGVLHVLRAVVPGMRRRGGGDLVMLGSVAGRNVYAGGGVYCASKYAVRAIYEALRLDLAGTGIRCTTVDPGMVKTDFSLVRFEGDRERAEAVYAGVDPLTPEDVADAVLWAVSRPPHVNVGEIVLWPTDQASVSVLNRRG